MDREAITEKELLRKFINWLMPKTIGRRNNVYIDQFLSTHPIEKEKEWISRISEMKDDSGREGCTYGDTHYDSLSAVYGYNLAIDNIIALMTNKQ